MTTTPVDVPIDMNRWTEDHLAATGAYDRCENGLCPFPGVVTLTASGSTWRACETCAEGYAAQGVEVLLTLDLTAYPAVREMLAGEDLGGEGQPERLYDPADLTPSASADSWSNLLDHYTLLDARGAVATRTVDQLLAVYVAAVGDLVGSAA
jgi:hypothetical protein